MRGWWLTVCSKLDLLFVVSNEGNTVDLQSLWREAVPRLLLEISIDGRPDLHVGAITPDLGTMVASGAHGPTIGGNVGGCVDDGDAGALVQHQPEIPDRFLIDSDAATNHPGSLELDLRAILSLGASGCGYQQHLAAIRAAFANPSNLGFRRDDAALGIIVVSDEDDCSALDPSLFDASTSTLGPLQHFRCTQFGVRCAEPDMTLEGSRTGCLPDASSTIIEDPAELLPTIAALAGDPRRVTFGAVIAPNDVSIELRAPAGSTVLIPALAHACELVDADSGQTVDAADPAVRLAWFADQLGDRGAVASICDGLDDAATTMGMNLRRAMGDRCIENAIDLARCEVVDQLGASETPLPPCAGASTSCYDVVTDEASCPHATHQQLVVHHDAAPGTYTLVRC
ncbi:MAG: hypothetical protein ABI678_21790 [Kofleriaceae bacterium]